MAFLVSPGVQVKETDLTNIIPAVASSIGGYAGIFDWGPAEEVTNVSSESTLIGNFGYPTVSTVAAENTREDWYAAANFLSYAGNLEAVRVLPEGALNAVSEADSELYTLTVTLDSDIGSLDVGIVTLGDYTIALAVNDTADIVASKLHAEIVAAGGVATVSTNVVTVGLNANDLFDVEDFEAEIVLTSGNILDVAVVESEGFNGFSIKNFNDFEVVKSSLAGGSVYAKYPGKLGDGIGIALIDAAIDDSDFDNAVIFGETTTPASLFDTKPATSVWAKALTGAELLDEVHVVVFTTSDSITGTKNEILEVFPYLSKARNAKTADNAPNHYIDYVNNNSKWVWLLNEETAAHDAVEATGTIIGATVTTSFNVPFKTFKAKRSVTGIRKYDLKGGSNGTTVTDANYIAAWDLLNDVETVDVSLLFVGRANQSKVVQKHVINICETRKDCIAFVSPDYASAVVNPTAKKITDYFNNSVDGFNSTSYAVFDSGWKRQYDRYNDEYFWAPLNADTAGLTARADATSEAWYSPAGLNRGFIKSVVKLSFNPNQADRDKLYTQRVNPVVTFRGQGTLLYGDKTALSRPSAFDRINVRRLFIVLEKAIATAAKFQLFEFNDDLTRRVFINAVEPFLAEIKSRRGMTDFKVVCDSSNNTGEVVDGNRFVADIYIKPTRSINFITLNFTAVRSDVSFSEIAGV